MFRISWLSGIIFVSNGLTNRIQHLKKYQIIDILGIVNQGTSWPLGLLE